MKQPIRPKYGCPSCQGNISIAPLPAVASPAYPILRTHSRAVQKHTATVNYAYIIAFNS